MAIMFDEDLSISELSSRWVPEWAISKRDSPRTPTTVTFKALRFEKSAVFSSTKDPSKLLAARCANTDVYDAPRLPDHRVIWARCAARLRSAPVDSGALFSRSGPKGRAHLSPFRSVVRATPWGSSFVRRRSWSAGTLACGSWALVETEGAQNLLNGFCLAVRTWSIHAVF